PTESSPSVASGTAITLPGSCTLKVRAYRTGWTPSDIISGVYTVSDRMYVNRNVSGFVHDGLSWQTAFIDVGDATGVAVSGHTIWVAAGTYYDDGGLTLPSGVALFGGFKGTETTLSQRNWVKNTTILDGMGDWTVVRIPSSASSGTRIDGFTIQNGYEKYSGGGGIDMGYGGQTVIAFNIIRFNSSWRGGAIYAGDMNAASIYNNVIYGNTATDGAAIYCSGEFYMKLVGNTIVSNTASGNGGGLAMEDTYAGKGEIKNNLIASNSSGIYRSLSMATLPPISYNCLYGNASYAYSGLPIQTGLNGNITAYPSFVNSGLNDYHLAFGSGCIDMGTGFNLPNFYDADGGTRGGDGNQDGIGGVDIGAYEFRRVYVDKDSASPSDGTTWARAFHTIQAGIDAACYGDEVWVAAGTYFEHPSIKDGAKLYGGFAGTENSLALRYWWQNDTIIDGSSAVGSAVTIQAGTGWLTRLDGFTVRNGNATIGGGIWCGNGSAAVIVNNKIGPNSAANYGGGIYCDTSSNIIANNLIVANTASLTGGALYLKDCSAPISYNTIVGNTGTGGGGGIGYTGGFPIISSNIIAFNNHGVYGTVGYPAFKYNNVYGNTSGNFYAGMTDPTGIDGNISADPLFGEVPSEYLEYGDYHLTGLSPCIDTAWNLYRPSSDLDGRSRPLYSAGDMGAYEYRRIYVDATSNAGFYDGSTWATAYHTITDGLNAARPGDEIWVAVNVYSE
ncbi:MAG: choice-of-anchor Q domain-containing protein, partial [Armatimonadota bacterium]